MLREIDLQEISDGKLYSSNDLVKAGCNDCKGCSDCCKGMGESIILDPLDVFRLTTGLSCTFEELLAGPASLRVVDGLVLPFLKMDGKEEACTFLNAEGRCSIHAIRPGICRLFPLGRYYEDDDFRYFLQVNECTNKNRTKVKVKKWLDMPDVAQYEKFVKDWHFFQKHLQEILNKEGVEEKRKTVSMQLLTEFYMKPYEADDFYDQFQKRMTCIPIENHV